MIQSAHCLDCTRSVRVEGDLCPVHADEALALTRSLLNSTPIGVDIVLPRGLRFDRTLRGRRVVALDG